MPSPSVPDLTAASSGPLLELERRIVESMPAIERWFRLQRRDNTPSVHGPIDRRNAGFKLTPAGRNLVPGGVSELSEDMRRRAAAARQPALAGRG